MDRAELADRLELTYESPPEKRRVVVRQAGDLADSGRYAESHGTDLTVETVLENLEEAPAETDLVERWNWWIGALDLSHEDYDRFRIRRFATE